MNLSFRQFQNSADKPAILPSGTHETNKLQIIHNPGTIPDARYLSSADLTVVFEGTYSTYQSYSFHKSMTAFQSEAKEGRNALAAIVHSLPEDLSEGKEKKLVGDLRRSVGSLFVTGLGVGVDYYAGFWEGWLGWVGDLGK